MKTRIRASYLTAVALTGFAAAGVSAQSTGAVTVTGVPSEAEHCAVTSATALADGAVMFRKSADGVVALKAGEHGEHVTIARKLTKTVDADGNVTVVEVPIEEGHILARTKLKDGQAVLADGQKVHVKRPAARGGKLEATVVDGHEIVIDRVPADGSVKVHAYTIDGKELQATKVKCSVLLRSKTDQ